MAKTKKTKKGFTLVEVTLFLAISGFLVAALIAGTSNTIARQRYNDSVQDFVSFLTRVYSEVIQVENQKRGTTGGNSEFAIYGKLISFKKSGEIKVYSVIGDAYIDSVSSDANILQALNELEAHIAGSGDRNVIYDYSPTYLAKIQSTSASPKENFVGQLLIVRSPTSGSVKTYYNPNENSCNEESPTNCSVIEKDLFSNPKYGEWRGDGEVDFCIDSDDARAYGDKRRNIRIDLKNGFNSSAIKLIDFDGADSRC